MTPWTRSFKLWLGSAAILASLLLAASPAAALVRYRKSGRKK